MKTEPVSSVYEEIHQNNGKRENKRKRGYQSQIGLAALGIKSVHDDRCGSLVWRGQQDEWHKEVTPYLHDGPHRDRGETWSSNWYNDIPQNAQRFGAIKARRFLVRLRCRVHEVLKDEDHRWQHSRTQHEDDAKLTVDKVKSNHEKENRNHGGCTRDDRRQQEQRVEQELSTWYPHP